jgi:hypothetical protein
MDEPIRYITIYSAWNMENKEVLEKFRIVNKSFKANKKNFYGLYSYEEKVTGYCGFTFIDNDNIIIADYQCLEGGNPVIIEIIKGCLLRIYAHFHVNIFVQLYDNKILLKLLKCITYSCDSGDEHIYMFAPNLVQVPILTGKRGKMEVLSFFKNNKDVFPFSELRRRHHNKRKASENENENENDFP